jgi:hypothetical protein
MKYKLIGGPHDGESVQLQTARSRFWMDTVPGAIAIYTRTERERAEYVLEGDHYNFVGFSGKVQV